MIEAMDHVEILVRDIEESVDFYMNVFGFEMWRRTMSPMNGKPWELACLRKGNMMIEVIKASPEALEQPAEQGRVGIRMIALRVDDMEKTLEYLRSKGVEVSRPPVVTPVYEGLRAEIKDINGISWELREWQRGDGIHNDAWQPSKPEVVRLA